MSSNLCQIFLCKEAHIKSVFSFSSRTTNKQLWVGTCHFAAEQQTVQNEDSTFRHSLKNDQRQYSRAQTGLRGAHLARIRFKSKNGTKGPEKRRKRNTAPHTVLIFQSRLTSQATSTKFHHAATACKIYCPRCWPLERCGATLHHQLSHKAYKDHKRFVHAGCKRVNEAGQHPGKFRHFRSVLRYSFFKPCGHRCHGSN